MQGAHMPCGCSLRAWPAAVPRLCRCPFCYKECGLGLATLLILASLVGSQYGMRLLLLGAHLKGVRTYEDLVSGTLGRMGSQASSPSHWLPWCLPVVLKQASGLQLCLNTRHVLWLGCPWQPGRMRPVQHAQGQACDQASSQG